MSDTTPGLFDDFRRRRRREQQAIPDNPDSRNFARLLTRQVLAQLAEARRQLAHQGRRSWAGRNARKTIAAAKLELDARGVEYPAGEEPNEKLTELLRLFPPPAPWVPQADDHEES